MDSDSWISARLSTSSRRYQSRSDLYLGGYEDLEGDDDLRAEFICPFCAEDYDVVGLCCHIDEDHPVEAKNGVCPVCGKRVGMDLVGHITMQHGNFLKVQRKRRYRKGGSSSTLSLLRRELREGTLQSLFGVESTLVKESSKDDFLERKPQELQLSDKDKQEKTRRFEFVQGLLMSTILDDDL
ncbi:hypothetical protein K1719_006060 [Acacia pycnantha]|nr:hypothetical protein K1719_006060 [Acacia pycnantha]